MVVPVLPLYAKELGIGEFAIGFLFATYGIALLVGAVPMGLLSDRWGRRPFLLFGMFAMSGAFIFYAFANTYPMLVLARALDGLTAAATWGAGLAMLGDRLGKSEVGTKIGWAFAAMAVGGIAGPLLGGVLADAFGYRVPFLVIAGTCAVGGVAALFLREERPEQREERERIAAWKTLLPVLTNRTVLLACLISLVTTVGMGLIEPTLPIHLSEELGMTSSGIGMLFGVMMVFYAAASPPAGKLSDLIGRKKPIMLGLLMTALIVPFIAVFRNTVALFVLMAAFGAVLAFFETPSIPMVTDALPPSGQRNQYGAGFGLLNFFWSAGYTLGPLLGGAITQWVGFSGAVTAYSVLLIVLLVVIAFALEDRGGEAGTRA